MRPVTSEGRCCLCRVAAGESRSFYDQVLLASSRFLTIPSKGALVSGYVLIVPTTHQLSLAHSDSSELRECWEMAETAAEIVGNGGPCVMFEHGPMTPSSALGCSVDHAHLHVVPSTMRLGQSRVLDSYVWTEINDMDSIRDFASSQKPYIFLRDASSRSYTALLAEHDQPSQLLRRAIATHLGRPHQFNWIEYPFEENVRATIALFSEGNIERDDERGRRGSGLCA